MRDQSSQRTVRDIPKIVAESYRQAWNADRIFDRIVMLTLVIIVTIVLPVLFVLSMLEVAGVI
ncbi:hypothetical protein [Halosolutus gelatinilyticus]|uniref:hypothetical protein n=1 Tax=Halosolutus gelatinilyticus TaxID=2931975 RepID=UPI001FF204D0|nr:hypothetical protein [Halosolutus gelatinilyticus]